MTPKTYGIGTLVYYDSFAGLIRGKVTELSLDKVTIEVTANNNPCYKRGEIITSSKQPEHIFPRECYHKTGIFRFYVTPFLWLGDINTNHLNYATDKE